MTESLRRYPPRMAPTWVWVCLALGLPYAVVALTPGLHGPLAVLLIFLAGIQFMALFMGLYLARQLGRSVDDLFAGVGRLSAGDYYDLFILSDGRLAFLIADASGKGTSAAFYAAETKDVVAALDKVLRGPREVAIRLNEIWCETHSHSKRMFITMIYGVFDPMTGALELVRAGHPPAFLRRGDGRVERLAPRGVGIGMSLERFAENLDLCTGILGKGEALVCYTDGLSEAASPGGEFFGENRLKALLAGESGCSITQILGAVSEFTDGQGLEDDLTLLVIQR